MEDFGPTVSRYQLSKKTTTATASSPVYNALTNIIAGTDDESMGVTVLCKPQQDPEASNKAAIGVGVVIDHACTTEWLEQVDAKRLSLPLDIKRPTVARRFFCDTEMKIVGQLQVILQRALQKAGIADDAWVYCNKYLRILEYIREGKILAPHADGHKICEDTGTKSTHTLLLFLTDLDEGGETVLMNGQAEGWAKQLEVVVPPECQMNAVLENNMLETIELEGEEFPPSHAVSVGVSPRRGRILIFPHEWPHAGAVTQSLPKIMLRAEVTLHYFSKNNTDV
jgi:hypothetical protein